MSETRNAVFRVFINGSVDAVWREITKTDERQGCFFNNWMEVGEFRAGSQLRMRSSSRKYTGVVGEIIEWDPKQRFGHTFKFTHYDDPPCRIFYELIPKESGVEFTMTLEEVAVGTKTEKDMIRGGDFITKTLKDIVENGRPSIGTRILFGVFRMLEPISPKSTRSENWPL